MSNIDTKTTHYVPGEYSHDYHGVVTIPLYELIDYGYVKWYDIVDNTVVPTDWKWDYYNLEQYQRLCDKFNARFMWDEISLLPPLRWKQQVIRKFNEIMPKYKILYEAADSADFDPFNLTAVTETKGKNGNTHTDDDNYGKNRSIHSEFPETILGGNADYVSHGDDNEFENIDDNDFVYEETQNNVTKHSNNYIDKALQIMKEYNDIDVMILNDLEVMFTSLYTVNVNGW